MSIERGNKLDNFRRIDLVRKFLVVEGVSVGELRIVVLAVRVTRCVSYLG